MVDYLEEGLPAHKGIQISPPADELPTHVTIQNQEVKLAPVPKQTPKPTGRKQSNEEEPSELKGIHTVFTTPEN